MKKILALTLSLLMIFSLIPLTLTASADGEYTRVLNNFDDIGRFNGYAKFNDANAGTNFGIYDYTEVDPSYTDGNVFRFVPAATSNAVLPIDPSWIEGNPISIKFQLWSDAFNKFVDNRMGISDNSTANVKYKASALGMDVVVNSGGNYVDVNATPQWITYDLTNVTITNTFMLFFCGQPGQPFYIDNITLVYANEEDIIDNFDINSYKTMYDWETDTEGVSKVGNNTFTRETAAAYSEIKGSTYGLKVKGTYSGTNSYIKAPLKEVDGDLVSLRVAMSYANSNKKCIGVEVGGVIYWWSTTSSKTNMSWEYIEYRKYTSTDGETITIDRSNINNITAVAFSFNDSYSNFYIDDIQYATLKASEPVEPAEKDGLTTAAVSTDDKASIRLNDKSGIRFYTTFDVSNIEGTIVEKGTLIGPADLVGDYLTFEDEKLGNAVAVPYLADTLWDNNEFVGSIVGIQAKNYNRAFTARAYVKLEDGTYLYSSASTTKTVAEIADAYIADANSGYADLDAETKKLVDTWAAAND